MSTLRDISVKELNRQALSSNEVFFIQSLIEESNVDYTISEPSVGGIRDFITSMPEPRDAGDLLQLGYLGRFGDRCSHRSRGRLWWVIRAASSMRVLARFNS